MKVLALKIDVDSQRGYREGVPSLLELFDRWDIRGSFFFSMGPDKLPSFWTRLRGETWPTIISSAPGIIRDADRRGHDCGLHAWNPQEWKQNLDRLPVTTLEAVLRKAVGNYIERTGHAPRGSAAPGWCVSDMSLRIQDELNFEYSSDTLGFHPFIPKMGRKVFLTPQIPTTLPPLEQVRKQHSTLEIDQLANTMVESLQDGLNVLSLRSENEGIAQLALMEKILACCKSNEVRILDLFSISKTLQKNTLPVCEIDFHNVGHFQHEIAVQGTERG